MKKTAYPACNTLGIDISSYSEEVRVGMEKENMDKIRKKVNTVHTYGFSRCADGYIRTKLTPSKKVVAAKTEDELYLKLYRAYFQPNVPTFKDAFESFISKEEIRRKKKHGTIKDFKATYKRFFSGSKLENMQMDKIKKSDLFRFLDDVHNVIPPLDEQRHNGIRTIINHVYKHVNLYADECIANPLNGADYHSEWAYTPKESKKDQLYWTAEERAKILTVIDSMENPAPKYLCVAAIFELGCRPGEGRALRYDSFHFDVPKPYVAITGLTVGRHREDRIKANSPTGKRGIEMTDRLRRVYDLAKAHNLNDEYLFASYSWYQKDDEVLISESTLRRAFMEICELAGVPYYNPYRTRFSNATQLYLDGRDLDDIRAIKGHTNVGMTQHYILAEQIPITKGIDNDAIIRRFTTGLPPSDDKKETRKATKL